MANRYYGEVHPDKEGGKTMAGTGNDDGRLKGKAGGKKGAAFEHKPGDPNAGGPSLPHQPGAED